MTLPEPPQTLRGFLRTRAAQVPDAVAIIRPGRESMRLGELARQAEAVGWQLRRAGLGPADRVGVVVPPFLPEGAVAIVGIVCAGCVLPVAVDAPASEVRALFSRAGLRGLVSLAGIESPALEVARELGLTVVELAPDAAGPAGALIVPPGWDGTEIGDPPGPADLAAVLTTSGTTDRPRLMLRRQDYFGGATVVGTRGDTPGTSIVLAPLHTSTGYGTAIAFSFSGDAVVFPEDLDPGHILSLMAAHGVTVYSGNPVIHRGLLTAAEQAPDVAARCSLKMIFSTGTALPWEMAAELRKVFRCAVYIGYGMTETNMIAMHDPSLVPGKENTVGKPLRPLRIAGEAGEPLGPGEVGEIQVQSDEALGGYHDDPESNTSSTAGEWFRTGDLGFLDGDGYLTITGRIKELINRGTLKVSPREVEAVLLQHPGVAEAVVFPVPHTSRGEDVAAAVVRADPGLTADDVRDHAIAHLSAYKVPRQVFFVDAVPTRLGKVPRRRMAELLEVGRSAVRAREDRSSLTPTETVIAEIWRDVLGLEGELAPDDDFFVLGGDSLGSVEMTLALAERLSVRATPADLLTDATLRGLGRLIDDAIAQGPEARGPVLVHVQPGADLLPVAWVHDGVGSVFAAGTMAFYLGSRRPVVAIEPAGMGGVGAPAASIAEMADSYVELLRPLGRASWIVAGHSLGGVLAFELARRLEAAGIRVPLVFAVEAELPGGIEPEAPPPGRAQRLREAGWAERRRLVAGAVRHRVLPRPARPAGTPLNEWHTPEPVARALGEAARDYQPSSWDGTMLFVKARETRSPRAADAWRPLVRTLEFVEVSGDHVGCMREPDVGEVGRIFRDRLQDLV